MNALKHQNLTEPDRYSDEVLNASWLPQTMLSALGLQPSRTSSRQARSSGVRDPESFLQRLYRAQE